jgi:NTE family protein
VTRALVLGGGGVTGIGWEIGLLAGLQEAGVDLTTADLLVGTSAGSVVATQVACGADLAGMLHRQMETPSGEIHASIGLAFMLRMAWAMLLARGDPQRFGARMGSMAVRSRTVPEVERRAVIAKRLTSHQWPDRRLLITAVDAADGSFVVLDRDSGVPLVDAVAASCAVPLIWPPITVEGRRLIDGGMRSAANADLASGCDKVVIVAPIARGNGPLPGPHAQAETLRSEGASVTVVTPDANALDAIGRNVLDPTHRAPAAHAGHLQAANVTDQVADIWST